MQLFKNRAFAMYTILVGIFCMLHYTRDILSYRYDQHSRSCFIKEVMNDNTIVKKQFISVLYLYIAIHSGVPHTWCKDL